MEKEKSYYPTIPMVIPAPIRTYAILTTEAEECVDPPFWTKKRLYNIMTKALITIAYIIIAGGVICLGIYAIAIRDSAIVYLASIVFFCYITMVYFEIITD